MSSKIVLVDARMKKPLVVSEKKLNGEIVYPFEKEFQMELNTNRGIFLWTVRPGYISNCGSIPWFGQKILRVKSFDPDNDFQNAFFFLHDDLYQKKGYGVFDRDDADALCRGGLRKAGRSRFQASTIDFFLMVGACGHWGDNSYHNPNCLSNLVKVY